MVLRIFKTIATSGFLTALECTRFVFGWGLAPDPAGGAYSALSNPIDGLMGPILLRGRVRGGREGRRKKGKKTIGKGRNRPPPFANSGSAPGTGTSAACINLLRHVCPSPEKPGKQRH